MRYLGYFIIISCLYYKISVYSHIIICGNEDGLVRSPEIDRYLTAGPHWIKMLCDKNVTSAIEQYGGKWMARDSIALFKDENGHSVMISKKFTYQVGDNVRYRKSMYDVDNEEGIFLFREVQTDILLHRNGTSKNLYKEKPFIDFYALIHIGTNWDYHIYLHCHKERAIVEVTDEFHKNGSFLQYDQEIKDILKAHGFEQPCAYMNATDLPFQPQYDLLS